MSYEATTSDEGTINDSVEGTDVHQVETADDQPTENERSPDQGDSDSPIKIDDLPEEVREYAKQTELQFKRQHSKKMNEYSAQTKTLRNELDSIKNELEQKRAFENEILSDPSKYEAYRALRGGASTPQQEPQFETVGDLVAHLEDRMQTMQKEFNTRVEEEVTKRINSYDVNTRWDKALEVTASKNETFKRYQPLVEAHMLKNPDKYKPLYDGSNETYVLEQALEDVMAVIQPDIDAAKAAKADLEAKKRSASTLPPTRRVGKGNVDTGKNTDEDVLARINQRLGGSKLNLTFS